MPDARGLDPTADDVGLAREGTKARRPTLDDPNAGASGHGQVDSLRRVQSRAEDEQGIVSFLTHLAGSFNVMEPTR